ncbi:MAG: tetratricopeptide repeat protein [Flavobacteriales bacterium]|nr:tetratricopeptide repeat protein [Flavobacteriales bacterium]
MKHCVYILIFFFLGLSGSVIAQSTDQKLAMQYYQNGQYEQAALYFQKLYKHNPNDYYYTYYYKSLVQLERYVDAEKLAKKQIKKVKGNVKYYVDLGHMYYKTDQVEKGKKLYEKAIKDVPAKKQSVMQLAKAFSVIGENEYALQSYLRGRKIIKGGYPFNVEVAELYGAMGRQTEMISEYLDLLEINDMYIQQVQNALARTVDFKEKTAQTHQLKGEILKRIQKNPNKKIYSELLIWIYIQQKDYPAAMVQTKALDKRLKEAGARVVSLAHICKKNREYDLAIDAYEYVLTKGKESAYYMLCKKEVLKVMNEKITATATYTPQDLTNLEAKYYEALDDLGRTQKTIDILKDLAVLQAFYIHNIDAAVYNLNRAIATPAIKPQDKAECKLILGDLLLIKGEVWDAALLYAQVDKDFKYDRLGERAKLKNAKVSYYTGNFNFAKGQLDVLKGSTSKLIANDAMALSILITDNSTIDTTTTPLLMYARADLMSYQNKDSLAILVLDSINQEYPGHALADEVLFKKYEIAYKNQQFDNCVVFLESITTVYSYDVLADDAHFKLAQLYDDVFKDYKKAKEHYGKILFEYKGSLYVVKARKRYREIEASARPSGGETPSQENDNL